MIPDDCTNPAYVEYHCKICGKKATAKYDLDCPIKDLQKWLSMLTCNSCYDYRDRISRVKLSIMTIARKWETATFKFEEGTEIPKELESLENKTRKNLDSLTKHLTTLICNHCGIMNQWDSSVVEAIMSKPVMASNAIQRYIDTLRPQ